VNEAHYTGRITPTGEFIRLAAKTEENMICAEYP